MLNRRCLVGGRNPGPPSMALHRRRLLGRRLLLLVAWPLPLCCRSGPRGTKPSARQCGSARIGPRERSSTAAARGSQTRLNTYVRTYVRTYIRTYACTLLPGLPPSAYCTGPMSIIRMACPHLCGISNGWLVPVSVMHGTPLHSQALAASLSDDGPCLRAAPFQRPGAEHAASRVGC